MFCEHFSVQNWTRDTFKSVQFSSRALNKPSLYNQQWRWHSITRVLWRRQIVGHVLWLVTNMTYAFSLVPFSEFYIWTTQQKWDSTRDRIQTHRNTSVFSLLCMLTTWHCSHLPATASKQWRCSNRLESPVHRADSNKLAGRTDIILLHRFCLAQHVGSATKRQYTYIAQLERFWIAGNAGKHSRQHKGLHRHTHTHKHNAHSRQLEMETERYNMAYKAHQLDKQRTKVIRLVVSTSNQHRISQHTRQ